MAGVDDRADWSTGRLLSTAARLTEQAWNERLRAREVSHAGLILVSLLVAGPASQRELAASQFLTEQTIGRTIGHLEATGHLTRSTDAADRRRRVVQLTEQGRALMAELSTDADVLTDTAVTAAGVDPRVFRSGLQAIIERLDDSTEQHPGAGPDAGERTT